MTQRIIDSSERGDSDEGLTPELHKAVTDRMAVILETGDGPAFYGEIARIASAIEDGQPIGPAIRAYLASLPEPQRTMFNQRLQGLSASQIAQSMGMQVKAVCRSLAKVFCDLRGLL